MTGSRATRYALAIALFAAVQTLGSRPALALSGLDLGVSPTNNTTTYVTFGDAAALKLATFTVETWFKREGTGVTTSTGTGGIAAFLPLVTKGAAEAENSNVDANYLLGINTAGNVIAADFEEGGGGTSPGLNHPISGVTPIVTGTWYHAAATYDGTTWRLYLNGELEAELAVGQPVRSDSIQRAALGTTLTSTGTASGFFDGVLDEARIWNTARTAAQIRATINAQNPADATLVARWGLDEGSGTAVGDSAGTPQNGTITGTNLAWVANGSFDVAPCANTASSLLRFDGTADYVTFGNATELGLTQFTVETWFKRENTGTANQTGSGGIASLIPLVTKGAPEADGSNLDANYIFGINTAGNVLAADFEDAATGLNHPVSGTTPIVNNNWYHAAATYDGSTWRLYLNGNLEATLAVGAFTPRSDSIQHAGLGTMLTSTGTRLGFFAGLLEEVRIWNVARSQAQIQTNMYQQLTSGSGLVARWGLGEGTGTSIADSVGPTLTAGAFGATTAAPAWTASSALFDAVASCDDGTFCNGGDTCSGTGANGLRCSTHAGDPCVGGSECNNLCNEAGDTCARAFGVACTADGSVCTLDVCDGAGACSHPAGNPGTLCRASAGTCDTAEQCDGVNTACPADAKSTAVCRGSGGACDLVESCDGVGNDCPADAKSSALCRASGGVCDPAESCDGISNACPTDAKSSAVCRGSGGVCDVAESCDGVNDGCPADAKSTALCRASAGACDLAETCDGVGNACPADTKSTAVCRASGGACDVAESCDGVADTCPADAKSTAVCRASGGACDIAESCDGVADACPADAKSTAVCRTSAGVCDVAESCDGSSDACPTDAVQPNSTVCRAASSGETCDVTETCDGSNVTCPADAVLPNGTTCRGSAGVCDAVEACDGAAKTCPADAKSAAVCRASGGACDLVESCDGVGNDCPADAKSTAQCRASGGVCDLAETCDGSSNACPADAKSTAVCRTSGGACDLVESCDGAGNDCPVDAKSTAQCRASGGACDPAEACDGVSNACPTDAKSTAVCRGSGGACDVAESCDGVGDNCPADAKLTAICRAAGGVCDVAETCDGVSNACPADAKSTAQCRASGGVCDPAETCDGAGNACPTDSVLPNGSVCRGSAGVCDASESCDGVAKVCPADAKSTAVCRAAGGACDLAESCDGVGNACPADVKSTAVCRAATGTCDVAESCDGVGDACPSDTVQPNGSPCGDGQFCNGAETCQGGSCQTAAAPCVGACDEMANACVGNCPLVPQTCRGAERALLYVSDNADDSKDKLLWKWIKGEATSQTEFGDPTTLAEYSLCLYAGPSSPLIAEARLLPGGSWGPVSDKGYKYQDSAGTQSGVQKVLLKGSTSNKSKALLKGRGTGLPTLGVAIPLPEPVTAQLLNTDSGLCWGEQFSGSQVLKNENGSFKGKK